jgi:tyrosine-protein phosphatase SIW14
VIVRWLRSRSESNEFGVPIRNFGKVVENIYRGGLPDADGYKALRDKIGVATVLNLMDEDPERQRPEVVANGMRFLSLPLSNEDGPRPGAVEEWLQIARATENFPLFVHCKGGRHRTGGLVAAYRVLVQDWTAARAYEEAKNPYGFYSAFGHGEWRKFILGLPGDLTLPKAD